MNGSDDINSARDEPFLDWDCVPAPNRTSSGTPHPIVKDVALFLCHGSIIVPGIHATTSSKPPIAAMGVHKYDVGDITLLLDRMHSALGDESGGSQSPSHWGALALESSLSAFTRDADLSCSGHCYDLKSQARIAGVITAAIVGSLDDGKTDLLPLLTRLGEISASAVIVYSGYPRHSQLESGALFRMFMEQQVYAVASSAIHQQKGSSSWMHTKDRVAQAMDAWCAKWQKEHGQ